MSRNRANGATPVDITEMFDEIADKPCVPYPSLTRDELLALADAPLLNDADDAGWWDALTVQARHEVLATAQRGLLARGLVSIDRSDAEQLDIGRPLRTVLALRRAPAFVTLIGNTRHPSPVLRCYGAVDADGRIAVLIEARVITGVAEYLLCSPSYAATTAARLLLAPPDAEDPEAVEGPQELGGRIVRRRLEIFPPGSLHHGHRYLAFAGKTAGALASVDDDGHAGQPREAGEQTVAELIAGHWGADAVAASLPRAPRR